MTKAATVSVFYANHRAIRAASDDLLFKIMCSANIDAIKLVLPSYKEVFHITPMPGQDIETLCEECFHKGNLDQPTITEAGRSMCVGDIVRVTFDNGVSIYRICANVGWTPFTP